MFTRFYVAIFQWPSMLLDKFISFDIIYDNGEG